jgi:type IV pilus assembly protein PilN
MRIAINLASEPFRRDRPVLVASVVAAVALVALLAVLIAAAVRQRGQAAATRQDIARLQREIAALNQEQSRMEAFMQQPANAALLDRVTFINTLLYRKGISWTKVFADLDAVVPYNVRLMSVRPQVDSNNQVFLTMVVATQTEAPAIEMVRRMEQSPLFGSVKVPVRRPPSQTDPLYLFQLSASYGGGL